MAPIYRRRRKKRELISTTKQNKPKNNNKLVIRKMFKIRKKSLKAFFFLRFLKAKIFF